MQEDWPDVQFRCMIQDILGNEIYQKDEEKLADRTIYYCITIPGENDWVRNCPKGSKNEFMTNESPQQTFRSNATQDFSKLNNSTKQHDLPSNTTLQTNTNDDQAASATSEANNRIGCSLINWSYPIPSDPKNKSCLIKVYDEKLAENLRVNDIVLVFGKLEPVTFQDDSELVTSSSSNKVSPQDDKITNSDSNQQSQVLKKDEDFNDSFEPALHLSHNTVPRVHVSKLKRLTHINPLVSDSVLNGTTTDIPLVKYAKSRLSTILTQLFAGDSLIAEYLILSLISRTRPSKGICPALGQFTLGIMGVKPEMKFLVDKVYELISKITTHSHTIDMSVANLNNLKFTPHKDYDNNKMIAGTLQLPDGMYLLINETTLNEGRLTQQGMENLNTLNYVIKWQKHKYQFKFSEVEIETDIRVLVMSDGKPLLKVPYLIKLRELDTESLNEMRVVCDTVNSFLNEELLNMFRQFITMMRIDTEIDIPDEVTRRVSQDFASIRKKNNEAKEPLFTSDDLSSHMTIARYLALCQGENEITTKIWEETCHMEARRLETLKC